MRPGSSGRSWRNSAHQSFVSDLNGAPGATPLDDTEDAEELARYRLTAVERRLESGLWAVISQTWSRSRIGRGRRHQWSRSVLSISHKPPAWDLREVPRRRATDRGDTQTVHRSQRMRASAVTPAPASYPA